METQRNRIMDHILKNGSITVRQAFEDLMINSPTKRISELSEHGYIEKRRVSVKGVNKDGKSVERCHYTVYTLTDSGLQSILERLAGND